MGCGCQKKKLSQIQKEEATKSPDESYNIANVASDYGKDFLNKIKKQVTGKEYEKNVQYADKEKQDKRKNICNECPHLIKLTKQCSKCGCFVDAKVKFTKSHCPLFYW